MENKEVLKNTFLLNLQEFTETLKNHISTSDNQWSIKGFIDAWEQIYTISSDTKIISKILEIHLFPKLLEFATTHKYKLVLAEKQNWYPDISFISKENENIKFAVDLKTTYQLDDEPLFCNGFTLGSHGEYFTNRKSTKNIQYPYSDYLAHYCMGILYVRNPLDSLEETKIYKKDDLLKIPSVISNFQFFVQEKWKIASDKSGSGNTANIGSINYIADIIAGNGIFTKLGENCFDKYWQNYGKIQQPGKDNKFITDIQTYLRFKNYPEEWIKDNTIIKKTPANIKENND